MMKKMAIGLVMFLSVGMLAVVQTKLTGIVQDAQTDMPLKGADVYLIHAQYGTTTDEDGFFQLEISDAQMQNDTLVISFLGYQNFRIAVSEFNNRRVVRLMPANLNVSDSVVVREYRADIANQEIPHLRNIVTSQDIELRGSSEIGDLFKNVPSVRIEGNDLNGRRIQIRGSDASEVNVYIDGVLINRLGTSGVADLSIIPVESIGSLNVLKGSNMTLLGNGAFGGIVSINTRKNVDRSLYLKTKLGSFKSQYYIGEVNLPITKKLILNYFAQVNSNKPGIEFYPGEQLDPEKSVNDEVDILKQNHNLRFDYYLPNGQLSARIFGYVLDYQKPAWQNNRKNMIAAGLYRGKLLGASDVDLMLNYQIGKDDINRQNFQTNANLNDLYQTQRLNFRAAKKYTSNLNEVQLLVEYFHDEVDISLRDSRRSNPAYYNALLYENRFSFAGVVGFSNPFKNHPDIVWKTHFGLRNDYLASGDNFVSPTVGIEVKFNRTDLKFTPYLSYGKNVRFHSLADNAFLQLQSIEDADSVINRLQPEENNSGELGLSIEKTLHGKVFSGYEASFAVFRNVVVNKLIQLPSDPSVIVSQIGRNETHGFESHFKLKKLWSRLDLQASATILNISELSLYPFKPKSMFSLNANYYLQSGLYLNLTAFREGKSSGLIPASRLVNELTFESLDPFFDFDVSVGYRLKLGNIQWHLQAAGYNILDSSAYQYYLLKKQYFQVSLSARM
jgi:outer membrane receptor protein involved in Fe transport